MKLTEAQRRFLKIVPDDWSQQPIPGDFRPLAPLLRKAAIEQRKTDVTPEHWGSSPVRVVRTEWRITEAGRQALKEER